MPTKKSDDTEEPILKHILYIDLSDTGKWSTQSSSSERAQTYEHCRTWFIKYAKSNNVEYHSTRGDDFLAYFGRFKDAMNTAMTILGDMQTELIRTNPCPQLLIKPRIIVFPAPIVFGKSGNYETLESETISNIIPVERDCGVVGRVVISSQMYDFLPGRSKKINNCPSKEDFEYYKPEQGKRKGAIFLYISRDKVEIEDWERRERNKAATNFAATVKQMTKILSANINARNHITKHVTQMGISIISKEWFANLVLASFREFLELTVKKKHRWHFKLALWQEIEDGKLGITNYAYPGKAKPVCYTKNILVKIGKNCVGECWENKTPLFINWNSRNAKYPALHDQRDKSICSVANFPIILNKKCIGVVSIDTNVINYFPNIPDVVDLHTQLASSFINNLALAYASRNKSNQ